MNGEPKRVVIVGGGIAGLEAFMALDHLAKDRVSQALIAPRPDFVYRPMWVDEPFGLGPAERHELAPLAEEKGARFHLGEVTSVQPGEHLVELGDGSTVEYDFLVVCTGARFRDAIEGATTFPSGEEPSFNADRLLDQAEAEGKRAVFIVPPGLAWALPLYEIALMTQRRAMERSAKVGISIVTPEPTPLAIFGPTASAAIEDLLRTRGIEFVGSSAVRKLGDEGIELSPGDRRLDPAVAVALPIMEGPALDGLPSDDQGFILVDGHGRVKGVDDVWAAGDGISFPLKQGGLGAQQADTVAGDIAHRVGAGEEVEPFRPVLRAKLLTGDESISLRTDVAGGGGEGIASADFLWWPPNKVSARYLAPLLDEGSGGRGEPEPPRRSLDVEVALPSEWHEEPMAIDPLKPPRPNSEE